MSRYIGNRQVAGISESKKSNMHHLLDFFWSDHIINRADCLCADYFSWHDGEFYIGVYNFLVSSLQGAEEKVDQGIIYYECPNKLKIAMPDQMPLIQDLYDNTGVAWFYILDTQYSRFKLPRTKYGFVGLRDEAGKYVPETLPNIAGKWDVDGLTDDGYKTSASKATGPFKVIDTEFTHNADGFSVAKSAAIDFDAHRANPTYQNNAPVQERATQMYLYFYVGEFSQTSVEQTAGMRLEYLNNKLDADHFNDAKPYVKDTYISGTSGYRVWSDGFCEQWGIVTPTNAQAVALFKTYKDTNYIVLATSNYKDTAARRWASAGVTNASTIWVMTSSSASGASTTQATWTAKGYLAEGEY